MSALSQSATGKYQPVELDEYHAAPCERCPKDLSFAPRPLKVDCPNCGARACRLMDLSQDELEVPPLTVVRHCAPFCFSPPPQAAVVRDVSVVVCLQEDFVRVVSKSKPSVSHSDLERYEKWTSEFGEEGS